MTEHKRSKMYFNAYQSARDRQMDYERRLGMLCAKAFADGNDETAFVSNSYLRHVATQARRHHALSQAYAQVVTK